MSTRDLSGSDNLPRRRVRRVTLACAVLMAALATALVAQSPQQGVVAGRNVNMVSGTVWPTGDPFLQRQNEPSVAVSTRNPLHMLAGANDYRSVVFPGLIGDTETGDAWLGVFKSFDGGQRWQSTLVHGYPLDVVASPLNGYAAGADPVVRAGAHGLFLYSGLVFDRSSNGGVTPGKSAVFVSRYIDNNNLEAGDPIAYLGTSIVASDTGATGRFLDKPWIAVDIPRGTSSTCSIAAPAPQVAAAGKAKGKKKPPAGVQIIPAGAIYVAYTVITYKADSLTSEIYLAKSADCGASWTKPVRLSRPQDPVNQGATIAINPLNGDVYVAWRRISLPGTEDGDAFLVSRSIHPGGKFSTPGVARRFPKGRKKGLSLERYFEHQRLRPTTEVADFEEFDQGTSEDWISFRTNAYPTMTFDGEGRLYMAWAERGFAAQRPLDSDGDARIVVTTTRDGSFFLPPRAVDEEGQAGHQVMPTLSFAGGRLMLAYYDLREDVSGVFGPYIDDKSAIEVTQSDGTRRRHTIELRATTAAPGDEPDFTPSTRVSEYALGTLPGETGEPHPLQSNPPNLPLFREGTVPFFGDYIDIAAAPPFVLGADGRWQYNIAAGASPVFHGVWTDNRDVRPPVSRNADGPDWSKYTVPGTTPPPDPCDTGTRNQNVYTARLTTGLIAGSPGNTKPLTMAFPRAFVVFAQNTTEQDRFFRFTILNQPPGGRASFLEYPLPPYTKTSPAPLTRVDVVVPRRSLVARTVYATSSDPHARIDVDVAEIGAIDGPILADGLRAPVVLNPDISNPDISNPDISNPDPSNPDISNAEVHNPDISNPDISNPDISNADISNPDISNPDISNPDISNADISNPDISNPDISNADVSNPDISNPDISNPDISNADISNGSITDVTWTVTNKGNTTTAFDVMLFFNSLDNVPPGIKLQLILYRVYSTPIANDCVLKEQAHNVLVANIVQPDIQEKPSGMTRNAGGPETQGATDPSTPTLWIEPGGIAKITLRIVDTDRSDSYWLDPTEISPVVTAQPKNTQDLGNTDIEPPWAAPDQGPSVEKLTFTVQPVGAPAGMVMPEFVVSVTKNLLPVVGVPVSVALADNPVGAQLTGTTVVTTDALGRARFTDVVISKDGTGFRFVASAGSTDAIPVLSQAFSTQGPGLLVTTTADGGPGSLRQAILDANANPGPDTINFAIQGTPPHTIAPATALPTITGPVTIDGTTQPGYTDVPDIAPVVILSGHGAIATGLTISGGNSTVRGLVVNNFTFAGIQLPGAVGNNHLEGNFIGTDVAGTAAQPNAYGVWVESPDNVIGGQSWANRNVISGNSWTGVMITGVAATDNTIRGNSIGADRTGNVRLPNRFGVYVTGQASRTTIGGASTAARNILSGNSTHGLWIVGGATWNVVKGNYVGVGYDGVTPLANNGNGIAVGCYGDCSALDAVTNNNTIGGVLADEANVIAYNSFGISLRSGVGNRVSGNPIFANTTLGIDLIPMGVTANDPLDVDTGPNQYQNFPALSSAVSGGTGPAAVSGSLASSAQAQFTIEFFANAACDPGGYGEGARYLGSKTVTTNADGLADFSDVSVNAAAVGEFMTATATDANGNTSEFSACRIVEAPLTGQADLIVTLTRYPAAPTNLDLITSTATVTNTGTAASAASYLEFCAGAETTGPQGTCRHTWVPPLSPGETFTDQREDEAGTITPPYVNAARADYLGTVAESNEGNNQATDSYSVVPAVGETVSGIVYYSTTPLDAVKVELLGNGPTWWRDPPLRRTHTSGTGQYVFSAVAPGNYHVAAYGPSEEFISWTGWSLEVVTGSSTVQNIDLPKLITLQTPEDGATGVGFSPTLTWSSIPEAVDYRVQINVTDGWALVTIGHPGDATSYTVPPGLLMSMTNYTWQVDGYDALGHHVGTTTYQFRFTTGPATP